MDSSVSQVSMEVKIYQDLHAVINWYPDVGLLSNRKSQNVFKGLYSERERASAVWNFMHGRI